MDTIHLKMLIECVLALNLKTDLIGTGVSPPCLSDKSDSLKRIIFK